MGSHSVTCHPAEVTFPRACRPTLSTERVEVIVVTLTDFTVPYGFFSLNSFFSVQNFQMFPKLLFFEFTIRAISYMRLFGYNHFNNELKKSRYQIYVYHIDMGLISQ